MELSVPTGYSTTPFCYLQKDNELSRSTRDVIQSVRNDSKLPLTRLSNPELLQIYLLKSIRSERRQTMRNSSYDLFLDTPSDRKCPRAITYDP